MDISEFKTEEEYVSQMNTGALLNPRVDSTFKALFTQPTEESKAALHSFLEAATERKIKEFELRANDAPSGFSGQRGVNYDILCEFDDGLSADIEMQAFSQEYDYGKRAEYQVARLETTYLKKGDNWEKAPVVYQVTVLDFNYGGDSKKSKSPISRYAMRTKDGRELSNSLNIIFIELPKTEGLENSLDTNTPLENWAIFLKEADNPQKQDIIQKLTDKEAGLMQAKKSLSSISANRDLWIEQYRQEIADRDRRSGLTAMMRKGLEEGMQKGLEEGMQKGMQKGILHEKYETAERLLKMGLSPQQVATGTGLAFEEVMQLLK